MTASKIQAPWLTAIRSLTTLGDLLAWAESELLQASLYFGHGTDNAWDEAVALASAALNLPRDAKASLAKRVLVNQEKESIAILVARRCQEKIPVPYITQRVWFADLEFYVDERVIIPRSPFAELIDLRFKPWFKTAPARILDLCTGSGCMAIACAKAFPNARIDAVDLSTDALAVAQENVQRHACASQLRLFHSDLFEALSGQTYDLIISNPPYVSTAEMKSLPQEYHFEPRMALEAKAKGLDIVNRIFQKALNHLNPMGQLFVEVGNTQREVEMAYPHLPLEWIDLKRGGHGIFMISAAALAKNTK
jgi:ribosomal protein L3 glutamine methyltransferase